MEAIALKRISPQEYLSFERSAKEKHEYFEGQVIAMAGASLAHNRMVVNLVKKIGNFLEDKSCEILPSDIRISVPTYESYMYPDATIVCGKPETEDEKFDILKNPSVIFEVLSPSTEDHDRGKKFFFYRQIPSLKEYVLISTTKYFVEISRRQEDNSWKFEEISDASSYLSIAAIDYRISLKELYKNVFKS
ncbi:MAG: Uma2 family endonuclease [Ginsengibacter sp.]